MTSNINILTSKIAFAVATGMNDEILLSVTPLDYFREESCQADWTPEEVFIELEHMGYKEAGDLMEGLIEVGTNIDRTALIEKLSQHPLFVHDEDFVNFCKSHESEEYRIIY